MFSEASVKNILSSKKEPDLIEDIVNGLIMRLIRRMCTIPEHDGTLYFDSIIIFLVLTKSQRSFLYLLNHAIFAVADSCSSV